jgi:hypothetical protein
MPPPKVRRPTEAGDETIRLNDPLREHRIHNNLWLLRVQSGNGTVFLKAKG